MLLILSLLLCCSVYAETTTFTCTDSTSWVFLDLADGAHVELELVGSEGTHAQIEWGWSQAGLYQHPREVLDPWDLDSLEIQPRPEGCLFLPACENLTPDRPVSLRVLRSAADPYPTPQEDLTRFYGRFARAVRVRLVEGVGPVEVRFVLDNRERRPSFYPEYPWHKKDRAPAPINLRIGGS